MTETDDSQTSDAGWDWTSSTEDAVRVDLQTDRPHSARMYDYYLGGKDNFPADREAAAQALAEFPHGRTTAQQNRAFMHRAIRYLVDEVGIRQFLDIGTSIPTSPNLHEVAQQVAPDARVVYADNDPIVLIHARALLTGTPAGRTAYLAADLRDVEAILTSAELRDTIDLTRPVAVSLVAILHFFPDADDPYGIVQRLLDALPSGSHVVISHVTGDYAPETWTQLIETYRSRGIPAQARGRGEIARFFEGLDLVEPGIQVAHRWRPDGAVPAGLTDAEVSVYGGVGQKK
ncbi:SAM-dependent methyltransferase [Frankia saprophytica]|uniref:SAM-dependent methyltransferase n=1 Tax=Pseudofrankia saprophytica TaxID=298655 RepID=UPI000234BE98